MPAEFQLAPSTAELSFTPFRAREVQTKEWFQLGVPLATGLLGAGVAVYSLSGAADPNKLRLTQFFLALLAIGMAVTGAVAAVDKVSQRVLESRRTAVVEG